MGIIKRAPKQFQGTISSEPIPDVDRCAEVRRLLSEIEGQVVEGDFEELENEA